MHLTNIARRKYGEIRKRALDNFINIRLFYFFIQSPSVPEPDIDDLIKLSVPNELYYLYSRCYHLVSKETVPGYPHITIGELDKLYKSWHSKSIGYLTTLDREFKEPHFLSEEKFIELYGADKRDRSCAYCSIFESEVKLLAKSGWIKTKRHLTRGRFMELDRKDPFFSYTTENLVLCCYWCNNAKTDEFSTNEFESIGRAMRQIWIDRLRLINRHKM